MLCGRREIQKVDQGLKGPVLPSNKVKIQILSEKLEQEFNFLN